MGASFKRTFIRSAADPVLTAVAVLGVNGYEQVEQDAVGMLLRRVDIWRDGDWVVIDDFDLWEPGDLGPAASSTNTAITVDSYDNSFAMLSRFDAGSNVATLLLGEDLPPGSGAANASSLGSFADLLTDGTEFTELQRVVKRSKRHGADDSCSAVLERFGLTFADEPESWVTLYFSRGKPADELEESTLFAQSVGVVQGVAGDGINTLVGKVGFVNYGEALAEVRLELGGSALTDGIVAIDTVTFAISDIDNRPTPSFVDFEADPVVLDLRRFGVTGHLGGPRTSLGSSIDIGLAGRFGLPGDGELVFTLSDPNGTASASASVDVSALDANVVPARRSTYPDTWGFQSEAQRMLLGSNILTGTLLLDPDPDGDSIVALFTSWAEIIAGLSDDKISFGFVDGVKSLPTSPLGGTGRRWARVVDRLATGANFTAHITIDGQEHAFDISRPYMGSPAVYRARFTIPNHDDTTFSSAAAALTSVAAQGSCWQGHLGSYASQRSRMGGMNRIYDVAVGHNVHVQPDARDYLEEPAPLVIMEHALAARLDGNMLKRSYLRSEVGTLIQFEELEPLTLRAREAIFEPILRPTPTTDHSREGLSESLIWNRPR